MSVLSTSRRKTTGLGAAIPSPPVEPGGGGGVDEPAQAAVVGRHHLGGQRVGLVGPLEHAAQHRGLLGAGDEERDLGGGVEHDRRERHPPHLDRIDALRSEEHTSELQSLAYLVCRLLLEKKKKIRYTVHIQTSTENIFGVPISLEISRAGCHQHAKTMSHTNTPETSASHSQSTTRVAVTSQSA